MPKEYKMKAETGFYFKDPEPEPRPMEWAELPKDRLEYLEDCKRQYLEVERTLNKLKVPDTAHGNKMNTSARVSFLANKATELVDQNRILKRVNTRQQKKLAQLLKLRGDDNEEWESFEVTAEDVGHTELGEMVQVHLEKMRDLPDAEQRLEESHRKGDL